MSEGPLAERFAFLLSKHVSACIKRLTLGKVQPLDVEQWPVIQGNQNGAGGETAPHAHRQPGEPGAGASTTIKLLTDNIYCRPTSLFINFSCTNVSQNLLMPTFLHQFMLNGPCPQPHLHPCPRPLSGRARGGCQSLSIPACCSALTVHYWLHESHRVENEPFKQ